MTVPLFHASGLYGFVVLQLVTGGRIVLQPGRFDEDAVIDLIEDERVTMWPALGSAGPRVAVRAAERECDLSSLRVLAVGGAPVSPATQDLLRSAFPNAGLGLSMGYTSSEAVAVGLVDAEGGISDAIAGAAELAGVDNYQVVNLREFLDMAPAAPPTPEIAASVTRMMNSAPPDAVFLLDSRMALPQAAAASDLDKQLMRLRNVDPATLSATYRPLETAPPTAGD